MGWGKGERRREVKRGFWSRDSFFGCICYHKPQAKNRTNKNNVMGQLSSQETSVVRTTEDEVVRKVSRLEKFLGKSEEKTQVSLSSERSRLNSLYIPVGKSKSSFRWLQRYRPSPTPRPQHTQGRRGKHEPQPICEKASLDLNNQTAGSAEQMTRTLKKSKNSQEKTQERGRKKARLLVPFMLGVIS